MLVQSLHREDIKAVLRKRHGSIGEFARKRGIKYQALADWLRQRPNAKVAKLVEAELKRAQREGQAVESIKLDHSAEISATHRQNAEVE